MTLIFSRKRGSPGALTGVATLHYDYHLLLRVSRKLRSYRHEGTVSQRIDSQAAPRRQGSDRVIASLCSARQRRVTPSSAPLKKPRQRPATAPVGGIYVCTLRAHLKNQLPAGYHDPVSNFSRRVKTSSGEPGYNVLAARARIASRSQFMERRITAAGAGNSPASDVGQAQWPVSVIDSLLAQVQPYLR